MSFWHVMFHFPDGGIYSNLLASLLWVIPGYIWSRAHFKKIHKHNEHIKMRMEQVHKKVAK